MQCKPIREEKLNLPATGRAGQGQDDMAITYVNCC